jgi:hypothetical protein
MRRIIAPQALSWTLEMVQLNSLGVFCETEEVLSVTSKLLYMAVWYLYVVNSVVRNNILIELSAL